MEKWLELYLERVPIEEILSKCNLSRPVFYRRLKKSGKTRPLGESHIGKYLTEEHKKNISKGVKGKYDGWLTLELKTGYKKITNDLAYILGVIYGDGYIISSGGIGLQVKDEDFADVFSRALKRQFGITPKKYQTKPSIFKDWRNGKEYKRKKTYIIRLLSVNLRDFMQEIKNFKTIKKFNKRQKISFLRGLWDSEGSIHSKNTNILNFTHNDLKICNLFGDLLLEVMGIPSKIYHSSQGNYILYIYRKEYLKKFYKVIQPTISRKRDIFKKILQG